MKTQIIFSIDYEGNGHILSVEDKDWIEKQIIICPEMYDNGIDLTDMEAGIYSSDIIFDAGRGWLNGDVYESESLDLDNIKLILKAIPL